MNMLSKCPNVFLSVQVDLPDPDGQVQIVNYRIDRSAPPPMWPNIPPGGYGPY